MKNLKLNHYQNLNNIIGWAIFVIASAVYLLTAEPTTSWWDCGEYISTAYKLEVGHPPGAPTFQLIGRFASLFTGGDVMKVAFAINAMSAICSGFTILFLFWSITLIGKKLVLRTSEIDTFKMFCIFGSGLVGALAYTFSDSFWFSAVEGEVYAMSSFFTAIVFWAILKWESQANEKHSLRWLILLAFLIGISIGVHLLNLLAIPAIVFTYYFKKYKKVTKKGLLYAFLISVALLAFILFIIVPYIVILAGGFDVFFVNSLGMPFNSGVIFYFLLLFAGIAFGLYWTIKKSKPVWNAVILSFLFILIGYSSFFILVIRSNANTPLNENAPKDAVSLRAYLGREQYGETPFVTGPYYTAKIIDYEEGYQKYVKGEDNYIPAGRNSHPIFEKEKSTVFPRMYSMDENRKHIMFYKYWTGIKGDRTPTFGENLTFFFRYQVNFMYWRYFMWNFAGRQNDIQGNYFNDNGTRDYLHGNWITGIKFWDEMRLGPQDQLPLELRNNKARNVYYCFPLILGLIGLFYHIKKDKQFSFIVFLLFFMTGLAIIIYLNQKPTEPRERDYAFAGSFYAFAIWIGLGVMALSDWISKKAPKMITVSVVTLACLLLVPGIMAKENWDDHDRSKKYAARDFSENYLDSCDKNSILITSADNDTFPLWFLQEVEGKRTDMRVLNYTLSGMHWYVEQLFYTLYDSKNLPFTLPKKMYGLQNDFFFIQDKIKEPLDLKEMLSLMAKNNEEFKVYTQDGQQMYALPTKKFKISLNIPDLLAKGIVTKEVADTMSSEIIFEIDRPYIRRQEMMFLDILASNGFERPLYILSPSTVEAVFPVINNYVQQEGLVYKVMPYKTYRTMNLDKTSDLMINKWDSWGNLNNASVYVDPVSLNNGQYIRYVYGLLADNLQRAGKSKEAVRALEKGLKYFPDSKFMFSRVPIYYAEIYHLSGEPKKSEDLLRRTAESFKEEINYYSMFRESKAKGVTADMQEAAESLYSCYSLSEKLGFKELSEELKKYLSTRFGEM